MKRFLLAVLLALGVAGCATVEPNLARVEVISAADMRAATEIVNREASIPSVVVRDVDPVEGGLLGQVLNLANSQEWLPYHNSQAPPLDLALSVPIETLLFGTQVQPSLSLNLQTTLVPERNYGSGTPTFTRATLANQTDFEGKVNLLPSGAARMQGARYVRNLLDANSATPVNWAGGATGASITTGVSDPLGGTAAWTLTGGAAVWKERYYSQATGMTVPVGSLRVSVWLRRRTGSGTVWIFTGADSNAVLDVTAVITTSWQRITTAAPVTSTNNSNRVGVRFGTEGDAVDFYAPFFENVTGQANQNPSEPVSVGVLSAPWHGAGVDGVKYFSTLNGNTVASNVVTEATGAAITSAAAEAAGGVTAGVVDASGPLGYLAEGARTNRALHSQAFSNAVWVSGGGGIAVADNSIAAPDGTTTADTLTASGANGTLIQDLGVVASAAKAGGLWLKRKTGTGDIDITLDGGSTWTTVAVTASWVRFEKTQTLADEDFGVRIVTSGDAVYAWQGQVETAAFLSSDIPTTTVAVARNADVLTYASAGNVIGTVGTITADINIPTVDGAGVKTIVQIRNAGSTGFYVQESDGTLRMRDGTNNYAGPVIANATLTKVAGAYSGSVITMASNGVSASGTFDGDMNLGATFGVGVDTVTNTNQLFGHIRNLRIYPVALPASRLKTLTTAMVDLSDSRYMLAANDDYWRIAANQ